MTRALRIVIVIVVGLVAAALGLAVSRQYCPLREPAVAGAGRLLDLQAETSLFRELKLSADQAAAVRALGDEYRQSLARLCQEHCALRARMPQVLFAATPDAAKTRDLLEPMSKIQLDSDLVTVEHIQKVYRLLTPEQKTRYAKLVSQCVCGECPTGMHACGPEAMGKCMDP